MQIKLQEIQFFDPNNTSGQLSQQEFVSVFFLSWLMINLAKPTFNTLPEDDSNVHFCYACTKPESIQEEKPQSNNKPKSESSHEKPADKPAEKENSKK